MTPEQLKGSILFAALQGKLVEQKENESPVDLSKVKAKKTEEIGFDIPSSWQVAHIESISRSVSSKQYQIAASDFKTAGKYPVVSQSKEYVIGYSDDETKIYHHKDPVIVFGDHTTIVKYIDFDFIVGADGTKIFEPNEEIISIKFFGFVLEYYSTGLEKVGGYSRHYKYVKDKPFPIPPIEEQKRIVAKIEKLLPYVDRYSKSYEKLEQFNAKFPEDMKKAILQYAIQGKLVEQRPEEGTAEELYQKIQKEKQKLIKEGKIKKEKPLAEITEDEIPFDIPESWKWIRFGEIYNLTNGLASRGQAGNPPCPVLRLADLSNNLVNTENVRKLNISEKEKLTHLVQENDLILIRVNGTRDRVGRAFLYKDKSPMSYCDHLFCGHALVSQINVEYIQLIFNSYFNRQQLKSEIKTTAGQNTIS